jgi:hypothetical protein
MTDSQLVPQNLASQGESGAPFPARPLSTFKWWFRPLVGTRMDKVNQYAFYEFGGWLARLREYRENGDRTNFVITCLQADSAIKKFLNNTSQVPLKLSKLSAQKLAEKLDKISEALYDSTFDLDKPLSKYDIDTVNKALDEFEAVLSSETQNLEVFSIPPKMAYSTTTLIEHGEEVLPEVIRKVLSPFTLNEIAEATKCVVFDLPTAAGFHLLRAVESAVREYYDVLSNGAPRPKHKAGNDAPMGTFINEIENLGANKDIVDMLRNIKTLYRDPHMHPGSVFSAGEEIVLLGIVTSAIWTMFK